MSELQRAFDAHLHIIDPNHPLIDNHGFLPEPFTVADYLARLRSLPQTGVEVVGGAVVSGSFQGFDQGYLIEALRQLGPHYVGVTQLPDEATDDQILRLAEAGVRALRFNIARGGSATLDALDGFARRVHDLAGWHAELYIDARTIDDDLADRIACLPAVSIDHLGLHSDGLPTLLRLVESGVKVKATGFGRVELDPAEAVRRIVDTNPNALMAGTDLPSTRARRPFADADFNLILQELDPAEADAVLWTNAANFYGIDPDPATPSTPTRPNSSSPLPTDE